MKREGADWAAARATELGAICGRPEVIELGVQANASPPVLRTHDRYGHRIDFVEYHPAYHELMRLSIGHGMHALPWREPRAGAHVARAAMFYLTSQVEAGHGCPISMTYSAVPALRVEAKVAREWEPRLTSTHYDPGFKPAPEKQGICGMAMTEKQGGSDSAPTPRAEKGDGGWLITGHKWFCSAPMSDAFLVLLAQTAKGVTCFLMPRWLPDGTRNRFHIQRLKDSSATARTRRARSSSRAPGRRIGAEVAACRPSSRWSTTRLDCVIAPPRACARRSLSDPSRPAPQRLRQAAHRAAARCRTSSPTCASNRKPPPPR
jgi:putative acyl-CoA dehydrogenase